MVMAVGVLFGIIFGSELALLPADVLIKVFGDLR